MNHYEVLQVNRRADAEAIRDAYRLQMQVWHPDKHSGTKLAKRAEDQSKKIAEAWSILKDPTSRASYDAATFRTRPAPRPRPEPQAESEAEESEELEPRHWIRDILTMTFGVFLFGFSNYEGAPLTVQDAWITGSTGVLVFVLGAWDKREAVTPEPEPTPKAKPRERR